MKKLIQSISLFFVLGLAILAPLNVIAQDNNVDDAQEVVAEGSTETSEVSVPVSEEPTFTEFMKDLFIQGGIEFMVVVLLCLIIGVAIAIERIIYLSLATVNTKKLLNKIDEALEHGGLESAKELCRSTRGPVGSIFYEGLSRAEEGSEVVERVIISGGSVQMGLMEKGVSWISLFIALAPMLGFLGTVLGMIDSFNAIEEAGGIKPTVVAGGIKTALITTVAGLVVAIILQVFYNVIVAKIDNLVNSMEDASNTFMKIVKSRLDK